MYCIASHVLADTLPFPGSIPEERHFDSLSIIPSQPDYTPLVKTQSTSNLLTQPRGLPAIDHTAKRMSIDAGIDRMTR
jgi:hypothetical protein